jgi:uncharacterized cupin superfamily protein
MFSILDGQVELTFRGQRLVARAGETVNVPANAPHGFHHRSDQAARLLCVCAPPGQEQFFTAVGTPVVSRSEPPPALDEYDQAAFIERSRTLAPAYRTELVLP